jgi:hypothetical protein
MTARSAIARCMEACNRPMSGYEVAEWVVQHEGGTVLQASNTLTAALRKGNPTALGQKIRRRPRAMTPTDKSRFEYYLDSHNNMAAKKWLPETQLKEELSTSGMGMIEMLDDLAGVGYATPPPAPTKPRITIDESTGGVVIETSGLIIEVRRTNGST